MPTANSTWFEVFQNVREQGTLYEEALSSSNWYLGFLSKADLDPDFKVYDILFEVVPLEWAAMAFDVSKASVWPEEIPASLFHMPEVNADLLITMLKVKTDDNVAEGSWYILRLEKKDDALMGDLYDPDIDMLPA